MKIQEAKKAEEKIDGGLTNYFDKTAIPESFPMKNSRMRGMTLLELFKGSSSYNITLLSATPSGG